MGDTFQDQWFSKLGAALNKDDCGQSHQLIICICNVATHTDISWAFAVL